MGLLPGIWGRIAYGSTRDSEKVAIMKLKTSM